MSDTFDHSGMPEDERLAAEYALGVLAGAERAEAAQRVARETSFAALVAQWETRLAPWAGEIDEVAPPPQVWDRIASALPALFRTCSLRWTIFVIASRAGPR